MRAATLTEDQRRLRERVLEGFADGVPAAVTLREERQHGTPRRDVTAVESALLAGSGR